MGFETHIRRNHNPLHCQVCHSHNAAHRIRTCKPFRTNGFQDRFLTNPDMQQNKRQEIDPAFQPESIRLSYIHDMLQSHNLELHGRIFTYEFPQDVGCNLHIL